MPAVQSSPAVTQEIRLSIGIASKMLRVYKQFIQLSHYILSIHPSYIFKEGDFSKDEVNALSPFDVFNLMTTSETDITATSGQLLEAYEKVASEGTYLKVANTLKDVVGFAPFINFLRYIRSIPAIDHPLLNECENGDLNLIVKCKYSTKTYRKIQSFYALLSAD